MQNSNTAHAGTDEKSERISIGVALDTDGPHLQIVSTREEWRGVIRRHTHPPNTGPRHRARLTILCAIPLAMPTAFGGVTTNGES